MTSWNVFCKKCKRAFVGKFEGEQAVCPNCGKTISLKETK